MRVVVIGGGIVGASCAYELALRGHRVTLLDQGSVGGACSRGNCGYVCPSHVYPLARPGAIAATLPLIFRRNSPFAIRPRLDLPLLAWFNAFRRHCRDDAVEATMGALNDLLWAGKRRYEEVMAAEGIAADYEARGCLFISRDESHVDHFEADNRRMLARFGFGARRLSGADLCAMEPALREGLGGAWFFECDAHLRPDLYMSGLRSALLRRGVTIAEHCPALALDGRGRRATHVETPAGGVRRRGAGGGCVDAATVRDDRGAPADRPGQGVQRDGVALARPAAAAAGL
jgi:D-amino-acid dehydrogenase